MKIFIGTAEIAGMMTFVANALRECGHEVTTCTDNYGSNFYNYKYDVILNRATFPRASKNRVINKLQSVINSTREKIIRRRVYRKHRDLHDVYIFIWNGFMIDSIADYVYLKGKGKKIISLFLGSDVRHISAFTQEYGLDVSTWEKWFHSTDLNKQLFRLRKAELLSDAVFSVPDQAGLAIRPYYKVYIPFNVKQFVFSIPCRTVPKIVHIPSRSGIKGTSFILETLDELRKEGLEFEFEFITGVSNNVVIEKLKDADILIDELFLHGPGTLSLEGIASGCAVATKTFENEAYENVVCNVNFGNLKEKIRKLIKDIDYRIKIAQGGRQAIETLNDPIRIASDIINKAFLQAMDQIQPLDYYPTFFSDKYILSTDLHLSPKNRALTEKVISKYGLANSLDVKRMFNSRLL